MNWLNQFEKKMGKTYTALCCPASRVSKIRKRPRSTANYPITIWRLTNFSLMTMIRYIEPLIQHGRWWPGYCNWHQDEQKTCLGWQLKIVKATKKRSPLNRQWSLHATLHWPSQPRQPRDWPRLPSESLAVTGPACLWASSNATCLLKDTSWLFSQTLVMAGTLGQIILFLIW